jgi:Raf kinase inhibitor-like YbhB/YbcL family protein
MYLLVMVTIALTASVGMTLAQQGNAPPAPPFLLNSTSFTDGGQIPLKYSSCNLPPGAPMVSPSFQWTGAPKAAVSFALIMHDADVNPMKGLLDVTHWTVYNIPASATQLPEGIPIDAPVAGTGVQGKNIRNMNGYLGPCPPGGGPKPHHFVFELYALDQNLDLPAGAARADLLKAIDGHIVGKTAYVGIFHN